MKTLTKELLEEAEIFLKGKVRETPVETSPVLSRIVGSEVFLKLEFLQLTGSFKLRGALFSLEKIDDAARQSGVATCSAGNHGWALAYAGRKMGIPVTVYVPAQVDLSKRAGIESQGAKVILSEFEGYDATEKFAIEDAAKRGLPFVSAFDDYEVMAGNGGSVTAEILEMIPDVENLIVPVGGGGLAAGATACLNSKGKTTRLIACQHRNSPALHLSRLRGDAVTELPAIQTLASGIEGGIGKSTFEIINPRLDQICLVSEEEIKEGVRWLLANHHYLIEPSSAVVVAACLNRKVRLQGKTVLVLTGRNISYDTLKGILCN